MPCKVRDYKHGDLEYILENPSKWCNMQKWFLEYEDALSKFTICGEDDTPVAVVAWFCYASQKATAAIIASDSFNGSAAAFLKEVIPQKMVELDVNRIETESIDCEELNKYHEFLGFTKEGVKRHYIGRKDYVMWSILQWV